MTKNRFSDLHKSELLKDAEESMETKEVKEAPSELEDRGSQPLMSWLKWAWGKKGTSGSHTYVSTLLSKQETVSLP